MNDNPQVAWDAIEKADSASNILALIDAMPGVTLEGRTVNVPDSWSAALKEKVRILRTLEDIVSGAGIGMAQRKAQYAKVHAKKAGWVQAHEALMREFAALTERYKDSTRAANAAIDVEMMDATRRQIEDSLGKLSCEYLEAHYQGWEMKPDAKKRLVMGWKLIGTFIEKLTAHM